MSSLEKYNNPEDLPSIEEIESALQEIKDYNSRHTGMGGALRRIINLMEGEVIEENNTDPQDAPSKEQDFSFDTDNAEAEISKDLTIYNVLPIFKRIGLAFYDGEKLEGAGDGKESLSVPSRQDLYIDEFEPFQRFIEVRDKEIAKSESVSKMVVEVYQSLIKDIELAKGDYRDALVDDLSRLNPIIKKMAFKSADPDLEHGEALINWGKSPEFDDYITARKLGLTHGKGFDAHSWHKDSPASSLERRWVSLLDHYGAVSRKYGDDNNLTILMKMEIKDALSSMYQWVENPPSSLPEDYIANINEALKAIKTKAKELHL